MPGLPAWIPKRQEKLRGILQKLLAAPAYPFAEIRNRDDVSEEPGIYAISLKGGGPGEYVHAGLAKVGGLRR
jgi:hypothetical protein